MTSKPAESAAYHPIAKGIFREYDIRGIAGDTLRTDDAYAIARAFATQAKKEGGFICVGRDGRLSSPSMAEAVCRGIADSGVDVVDVGLGPTPMLYFAAHILKAAGAVMVTGSHNPPTHNGMKFVLAGKPFYGESIRALHSVAEQGAFAEGSGQVRDYDIKQAYIDTLLAAYDGEKPLHVAWDAGNGAAGEIMTVLCQRLPGSHIALNATIDGRFPTHHPDPSVPENLYQLVDEVKRQKLDVGIAFDGDGDRLGIVDDEGYIIWPDQLMMLYARDVLKEYPNATIIADVKSSGALFKDIEQAGGRPLMWKTGHSHIKAKMQETGAKLAGEMSGHLFFADRYFGYDDALYAAVRTLGMVSRLGIKLSDWRKKLPVCINTPEMRFACDDTRKFEVITEVRERLQKAGADFSDIDGVRVNSTHGWWLLRASNTQPILVARCEASDAQGLERLMQDLQKQLTASGIRLPS